MAKDLEKTVIIQWRTIWNSEAEKTFTGTPAQIEAEAERLRGLADVKSETVAVIEPT